MFTAEFAVATTQITRIITDIFYSVVNPAEKIVGMFNSIVRLISACLVQS